MTPYELYQQFLAKYSAPQQGIASVQPVKRIGGDGGDGATSSTTGGTAGKGLGSFGISFSDVVGTIASMMTGTKPATAIATTLASKLARSFGFGDASSTGTANATDTGDLGSEAANNAATAAANASVGMGSASSSSGADGGGPGGGDSGDTGGPFRDGGRATLYDGGEAFDNYSAPEYTSSNDTNLSDYFNANINYSTGEKNPRDDVNVGTENMQAIMNARIPIDDKFSLLSSLGYFKNRESVKYKDYPGEIYKDSSRNRSLGLGYYDDGLSASGMYNIDTKNPELRIEYKKNFANGGRISYLQGGLVSLLRK